MSPPLKIASRLIAALSSTASESGSRIARSKAPLRKQSKEMSGTLAALKSGTPSALTRPGTTAPTSRRPVGGSALLRTQSMPSMAAKVPLNEKDEDAQLQEALANSRADAFMEPTTHEEEDAQLRKALLHSRADVFMPTSASHDPEETQLQQALALSRADVFLPPTSMEEEAAQLRQAIKNSLADTPEHKTQSNAPQDNAHHGEEPHAEPSHPEPRVPFDPFAASQDAQMKIQIAMKKADVLKAFGDAMKELTKS